MKKPSIQGTSTRGARPILLDAQAAKSCPVKTRNAYDTAIRFPVTTSITGAWGNPDTLQEVFTDFENYNHLILDVIAASDLDVEDLRTIANAGYSARIAATAQAVNAGRRIIISPGLPLDFEGRRKGQPDVLVRGPDKDGHPGYFPVKCEPGHLLQRQTHPEYQHLVSKLSSPVFETAAHLSNASVRDPRQNDLIQLCHYWRMLEAANWQAGGPPIAGIIGEDHLSELVSREDTWFARRAQTKSDSSRGDQIIIWLNLDAKIFRTPAKTTDAKFRLRSALDRYDHEHGFRVKVAEDAVEFSTKSTSSKTQLKPIVTDECTRCPWWDVCLPQLATDDLSVNLTKFHLDVREISVLRTLGISTIADLARTNLANLLPRYLAEVTHRDNAEKRLRLAAKYATLLASGHDLERTTTGSIAVPRANVEIDLDIETSADNRVYLWGILVHDRRIDSPPRYLSFSSFVQLDAASENALAEKALTWLCAMIENTDALVYHYSNSETTYIKKLTAKSSTGAHRLLDKHRNHFVDLFEIVRRHFFGAHGLSLKQVAKSTTGFTWRDSNPSGLNSQTWFKTAICGKTREERTAAVERVLRYNEDDVRATAALRNWLTSLDNDQARRRSD